jgi:hypothetical protein
MLIARVDSNAANTKSAKPEFAAVYATHETMETMKGSTPAASLAALFKNGVPLTLVQYGSDITVEDSSGKIRFLLASSPTSPTAQLTRSYSLDDAVGAENFFTRLWQNCGVFCNTISNGMTSVNGFFTSRFNTVRDTLGKWIPILNPGNSNSPFNGGNSADNNGQSFFPWLNSQGGINWPWSKKTPDQTTTPTPPTTPATPTDGSTPPTTTPEPEPQPTGC